MESRRQKSVSYLSLESGAFTGDKECQPSTLPIIFMRFFKSRACCWTEILLSDRLTERCSFAEFLSYLQGAHLIPRQYDEVGVEYPEL